MPNPPAPNTNLVDEVQRLAWGLLDEQLSNEELTRLEQLLRDHEEARTAYLSCMQINTDLTYHFTDESEPKDPKTTEPAKSPVLGFLNEGLPPLGVLPHVVDNPDT